MKALIGLIGCLLSIFPAVTQEIFPPAAGLPGSTAIPKDSNCIKGWADHCTINRGYINISDTTITYEGNNKPTIGDESSALNQADGMVVSLGDGGTAVLTFTEAIGNGEGPDFAVFENGFEDQSNPGQYFLELAMVEVSTDGENYVRFPAVSLIQADSQMTTFGHVDPTKVHNLAGKYAVFYGVPFDLEDLTDSAGIDINNILYIRILDVVGCIQDQYASYDSRGNKVNDPWPTPFNNSGFDLDAVAVINYSGSVNECLLTMAQESPEIYPSVVHPGENVYIRLPVQIQTVKVTLMGASGITEDTREYHDCMEMTFPIADKTSSGIWFICISTSQGHWIKKIFIIGQ